MKSRPLGSNESILATDHNTRRDDARGGSFLLAHEQLGALAMPTNPTNGQTVTLTINGTAVVITYVSAIGSTSNNVLIQGSAALTATATVNFLRRPDLTNSNQVAAIVANRALLQYLGWSLPAGGTTLTPFSLNKEVNGAPANLTSLTASATVTGASWTAQTMQLYVEDGVYYIGTTRVVFAGGSTPTVTAPSSHPRIDVLSINSSGILSWTTGTENTSPVAPTYPTGQIVICELYNVVSETALYDNENQQSGEGYIYNDVRPILGGTYISSTSQVASGLFILDPGSEVQGNILYCNGSAWVLLAPGVAGQFLETQGSGANPQWSSPTLITMGGGYSSNFGTIALYDDTTSESTTSSTPVKVHEIQFPSNMPTTTFVIGVRIAGNGGVSANSQIYKNGSAVGTLHTQVGSSFATFTDSLSFTGGDLCQVYLYTSSMGTGANLDEFAILALPIPENFIPTKNS